jgi:hypothetical protein
MFPVGNGRATCAVQRQLGYGVTDLRQAHVHCVSKSSATSNRMSLWDSTSSEQNQGAPGSGLLYENTVCHAVPSHASQLLRFTIPSWLRGSCAAASRCARASA